MWVERQERLIQSSNPGRIRLRHDHDKALSKDVPSRSLSSKIVALTKSYLQHDDVLIPVVLRTSITPQYRDTRERVQLSQSVEA